MSITAIVENDSIKLPPGVHVPDGTPVEIMVPGGSAIEPVEGPLEWMKDFVGSLDTLPADAAERHTDYAHGRKRRIP